MMMLERRIPPRPDSYFSSFLSNVTSQSGEDGILGHLLQLLNCTQGYIVDIGAHDGVYLSNSYNLLINSAHKFKGILVEANEERFKNLQNLYSNKKEVITLNHLVSFQGNDSLNSLFEKYDCKEIDLLSIDIDGNDYHLWDSLHGTKYNIAKIVCIEFNPTIPNNVFYIQEPNIAVQHGSSLLAIKELGVKMGYALVSTTIYNAIFVRNDLLSLLPVCLHNLSVDELHEQSMVTEMFQTYDGELKYVGAKKLMWHRVGLNHQKLQILNVKDRKFPFAPPEDKNDRLVSELRCLFQLVRDYVHPILVVNGKNIDLNELKSSLLPGISRLFQVCQELFPRSHLYNLVVEWLSSIVLLLDSIIILPQYLHVSNSEGVDDEEKAGVSFSEDEMYERHIFLDEIHQTVASAFQRRAMALAKGNPEATKELLLLSLWVKSTVPTIQINLDADGDDMRPLYNATSNIPGSFLLEKYYYLHCTTTPTAILDVLKEKKKIVWKAYNSLSFDP